MVIGHFAYMTFFSLNLEDTIACAPITQLSGIIEPFRIILRQPIQTLSPIIISYLHLSESQQYS